MKDLKCVCAKIVCQIKDDKTIVIKCRHCKREIIITTGGITNIEYK